MGKAISLSLAALLAAALPARAGAPQKPPVRDFDGVVIGPCDKSAECEVAQPHGCCDNCEENARPVKKGNLPEPPCGCADLRPELDRPACGPASQKAWFKPVCRKHVCALERKPGAPPDPPPAPPRPPRKRGAGILKG